MQLGPYSIILVIEGYLQGRVEFKVIESQLTNINSKKFCTSF